MSLSTAVVKTTSDGYDGHKLPCTPEEQQRTSCLQGKCYAVDLNPRVAGCECDSGWTGDRCELMEVPPDLWDASSLAGLIIGLIFAVILVAAVLVGFILWKRRRGSHNIGNREERSNLDEEANRPLRESKK